MDQGYIQLPTEEADPFGSRMQQHVTNRGELYILPERVFAWTYFEYVWTVGMFQSEWNDRMVDRQGHLVLQEVQSICNYICEQVQVEPVVMFPELIGDNHRLSSRHEKRRLEKARNFLRGCTRAQLISGGAIDVTLRVNEMEAFQHALYAKCMWDILSSAYSKMDPWASEVPLVVALREAAKFCS